MAVSAMAILAVCMLVMALPLKEPSVLLLTSTLPILPPVCLLIMVVQYADKDHHSAYEYYHCYYHGNEQPALL